MKADLILLVTAAIWGFAFVAQRMGMAYMGPFTFNAIRFSLGALSLVPVYLRFRKYENQQPGFQPGGYLVPGILTGLVLFCGASLQQMGLVGTTAGKAGFITGLYVILVPLLGLLWRSHTHPANWMGAVLAVIGLYLLSIQGNFKISSYDLIVLAGALMWAVHVHLIARYSAKVGAIRLSILQFAICGLLSGVLATGFESTSLQVIQNALGPLLYGGFLSVGVAYTLQVVAQRTANPSHAVIILSLEGVFAVIGGWLVLDEVLSLRALLGCALILVGMLVSQIFGRFTPYPSTREA